MTTTQAKKFKFKVNDQEFESDSATITGREIRQLAQIPSGYQLFQELKGQREDRMIGDDDTVNLAEPGIEKLYTVPPATFGRRGYR